MVVNQAMASPGTAPNDNAYPARQASTDSSSQYVNQEAQNSDLSTELRADERTKSAIFRKGAAEPLPIPWPARRLFWPRDVSSGSSSNSQRLNSPTKANPPGAIFDDSDAGADSRQSLTAVSAACSADGDACASLASAAGASGCLPAAASLRAHLALAALSSAPSSVEHVAAGMRPGPRGHPVQAGRTPAAGPAPAAALLSAALVPQNTRNIHDVARLVSQLYGSEPGREFSFAAGVPSAAPQKRLKLQSCWPSTWRKKMTGLPACPAQLSKAEASKIMHAAVLSQGGATISDVVLDLGRTGALVLQGTSRTELRNVHIEGGILLCHGRQCHLSLSGCSLKACKLIVSGGATVDIQRTRITDSEHLSVNTAAFVVSGRHTKVHVADTRIRVGRGFLVQDRAALTGSGVHVSGASGALVTASGAGTDVTLERSDCEFLRDKSNPAVRASARVLFRGTAAVASDGGAMTLRQCDLRAFYRGAHAVRHGKLHLEGCTMQTAHPIGVGVYAQMGSVSMKDTVVLGAGEHGVSVGGGGPTIKAQVLAENCTVDGWRRMVVVQEDDWSCAELRQCEVAGRCVTSEW